MKIAIVRLSAMGDIIHSAVILEYLYKNGIKVDWIADSRFASILDNSPYIDKIRPLNLKKDLLGSLKEVLKWEKYDLVIDFQGLLKSAILSKIISKKVIGCDGFHTKEKLALLFYNQKLKIRNHSMGRYKEMINKIFNLNITDEMIKNHTPYMFYKANPLKEYFASQKKNIIFIVGSNDLNRMYPTSKWIELANSIDENILIPYGNSKEKDIADEISLNSNAKVLPKMNLEQLKATISHADLLIGNDTGPSYIAWANNIKNILLFGATPKKRVLENKYTKIIKSKTSVDNEIFSKKDFSIKDIEVSEIINAVKKI